MKAYRSLVMLGAAAAVVWALTGRPWALGADPDGGLAPAPEFTHSADRDWINARPLKLAELRDRVVLIEFWTYGCWNCRRSFPWVRMLAKRYSDRELVVVGVHTPEFKYEMDPDGVRRHVAEFGLDHPVMLDNDFSYWEAMGNRYWPTFYLIDKSGRVRLRTVGEVLPEGRKAAELEDRIRLLLAESD